MAGTWGWTVFAFIFPPMYQESQQVWADHLKRGIGDGVKEESKTQSQVPAEEVGVQYVAPGDEEAQAVSSPNLTVIEKKIYETWQDEEQAKIAIAVAKSESHLNPQAIGDGHLAFNRNGIEYGKSYGVFQVRFLEGRPNPNELLDPDKNIAYAYELYQKSGFQPWSQYKNGNYKKYL